MPGHNAAAHAHLAASSGASQAAGEGEHAGTCTQDEAGNATDAGNAFGAIWRVHQQDDATSSATFLDLSELLITPQ